MTAWYTVAWMDKELKGDPSADKRLLTTRWQDDRLAKEVDGQTPPDGNLLSTYFPSRLDIARGEGRFVCEDLRAGCPGQGPDGLPPDYSFLAATQIPDTAPGGSTAPAGSTGTPPAATGPQAVTTVSEAGGCTPRSRITKLKRKRNGSRVLRISGTAAPAAGCPARSPA